MKERSLPKGWRLSGEYSESRDSQYVKQMTEAQLAIPRLKREVPNTWNGKPVENLTQEERQAFYFSMQPKSTQDAILRQKARKPEEDIDYLLRPMPADAQVRDEKGNVFVAERTITAKEMQVIQGNRHGGRNQLGQSTTSSVDSSKRDKGIEAFTYSKPAEIADEDIKRIKKLIGMDAIMASEAPNRSAEPKTSLSFRISCWLKDKTGIWWW